MNNTSTMAGKYMHKDAMEFAKTTAQSHWTRPKRDWGDTSEVRDSTPDEAAIIEAAIGGALLAILDGFDKDAAMNTAEYAVIAGWHCSESRNVTGHVNAYMSAFVPIGAFLRAHGVR